MMTLKIISLGRGASGVRREVIEQLQGMLGCGVYPLVPQQGSVGASGDLAPLAHMTAVMIGEGQAILEGRTVPGHEALADRRPHAADPRPQGRAGADQRHAVLHRLRHLRCAARIA
jgi:histidine ammonia-lyase